MTKQQGHIRFGVIARRNHPIKIRYFKHLNKMFPDNRNHINAKGDFFVYAQLRANSKGSKYSVVFISKGWSISVRVYSPFFQKGDLLKIPHIFVSKSNSEHGYVSLCLYKNNFGHAEFRFGDKLDTTIIAWTKEWLYFYELFLITGRWYGNGEHPQ